MNGEFLYTLQYFDGDPYGETVCVGGSGTNSMEFISLKEKTVSITFLFYGTTALEELWLPSKEGFFI